MNEDNILDIVNSYFTNTHKAFSATRGDDCASFKSKYTLSISTDIFSEDVHFRTSYFSPQNIGHKALAVNLSDLAASGASPMAFTIGLCLPKKYCNSDFLRPMLSSMSNLAKKYKIFLAGGDLSAGDKLVFSITVWGEQKYATFSRAKAKLNDVVFTIGDFGLARAGLHILENNIDPKIYSKSILAHLMPEPKCNEAIKLAKLAKAKKMRISLMDLSDGLMRDIPRLIGFNNNPNLALDLNYSLDDVEPEVISLCKKINADPLIFSLEGGEDYALLGATSYENYKIIERNIKNTHAIGKVVQNESGIYINGNLVNAQAFDHFQN